MRSSKHDVTHETIYMLIETMLNVIDHLEKKWLDEQLQREELLQHWALERKRERNRLKHLYKTWARWAQKRFLRGKRVSVVKHTM